jgi:hypothetical protein
MKLIKLGGKYAVGKYSHTMVDDEDYEELLKYGWYIHRSKRKRVKTDSLYEYYSVVAKLNGKQIKMSRMLMDYPIHKIDHKDHNPLNNQKYNLRIATNSQNGANKYTSIGSSSNYLGVYFHTQKQQWMVALTKNQERIHIGVYNSEIQAAEIYDIAALKYHGDFANLNFPENIGKYKTKLNCDNPYGKRKTSSNYNGVCFSKRDKLWVVNLTIRKIKYYASFKNELEAAKCYDLYLIKYNGNIKKLNFPENLEQYKKELETNAI